MLLVWLSPNTAFATYKELLLLHILLFVNFKGDLNAPPNLWPDLVFAWAKDLLREHATPRDTYLFAYADKLLIYVVYIQDSLFLCTMYTGKFVISSTEGVQV